MGGLFAAAAVLAGASRAHGLKERLTANKLQVYETAVRYRMSTLSRWCSSAWSRMSERDGRR